MNTENDSQHLNLADAAAACEEKALEYQNKAWSADFGSAEFNNYTAAARIQFNAAEYFRGISQRAE
jgi:hypothetical protein